MLAGLTATSIPQTGSRDLGRPRRRLAPGPRLGRAAPALGSPDLAGDAGRRSRRGSTSAISSGVSAPISRPAGVCSCARSSSGSSSDSRTASPRIRLATRPTYGTPSRSAAVRTRSSSWPCEATTTAASSARARLLGASLDRVAERARRGRRAPGAIGVRRPPAARGAGSRGSRKISSAPPLRHGFFTVTSPSAASRRLSVDRRGGSAAGAAHRSPSPAARESAPTTRRTRRPRSPRSCRRRGRSPCRRPGRWSAPARTTVASTNGLRSSVSCRPARRALRGSQLRSGRQASPSGGSARLSPEAVPARPVRTAITSARSR